MKKIIPLILLLFLCVHSFAIEKDWVFERKTLKDGLSNTYIFDITKDSRGFIWIATQNGLNRYDAYSFLTFNHNNEDESSISSDVVHCVHEDSKGRIWIGTDNGLNQYNRGTGEFEYWQPDTLGEAATYPNFVTRIVEDSTGVLWIGTSENSVIKFNPDSNLFTKPEPVNLIDDRFYLAYIRSMIIDSNQNIWIGTNGFGIIKYALRTNEMSWYLHHLGNHFSKQLAYTFAIHEDDKGDVWIGTYIGGLAKYEPENDNFRFMENPYNPDEFIKNGIVALGQDTEGNLILGANGGGVFLFDRNSEEFIKNYRFDPINEQSLSDDFVGEIFVDESGLVWLGTENGGISVYDPGLRKFDLHKRRGTGLNDLPDNVINTIYEDDEGLLWIGTENNGFASLDRKTKNYNQYRIINAKPDRGNTFVKRIIPDGNGNLWVATHMGGVAHVNPEGEVMEQLSPAIQTPVPHGMVENDITAMHQDKNGDLWVAGYRGLERKRDGFFANFCLKPDTTGACNEIIHTIYPLDSIYLLIGYRSEGFAFFNRETENFDYIYSAENSELSHKTVNTFCKDSKGRLWIGTDKGLGQFHFKDKSITTLYKMDGLPDNKIFGILEDDNMNLWISTNFGLCCFNPDSMAFRNFYESDGLQSNVFRLGAYHKSESGELFFGGVGGFNAFYPDEIKTNPIPPQVVFTDFQVFNKSVKRGDIPTVFVQIEEASVIELNYDEDIFSFEFTALNYTRPEENEYAYMLDGFHEDWQYIGNRRYITFTNIPPGYYTLRVIASNNDGVWNEEGASIKLIIYPPFWETTWFRVLIILMLLLGIYSVYKWRVRSIQKQNKFLEEKVRLRTNQIEKQKNEIETQKELVEQKNRDVTASIRYSKRIQDSFLPDIKELVGDFEDAFVFFSPKDIVSGDFYWIERAKESKQYYIAVADCTGHGVPGAMVSVVGNNGLNRSVNELFLRKPNEILDNLNAFIQRAFARKDSTSVTDGMDIALCAIDSETKKLQFAGANNPVWILRNSELIALKGTKQPIGKYRDSKPFDLNEFQLQAGDWVFLFSDGYPDQFGGPLGKKYKYARLKQTLINYNENGSEGFEAYLREDFYNWKGDLEQLDDVCILGIKIK